MEHEKSLDLISWLKARHSVGSPEVGKLAEAMIEALERAQAKEQKTMETEKYGPCWVHNLCPVKIPLNLTIPGIDGAVLPVGSLVGDPARGELKLELTGADPIIRIKPGEAWRVLAFDTLKDAASRIVLGTPTTPQPEPEAKAKGKVVEVIPSYRYTAAGRVWFIDNVELEHSRFDDDGKVLPGRELSRMTAHVAREILTSNAGSLLQGEELDYLLGLSAIYASEVDEFLGVPAGTVSSWIEGAPCDEEFTREYSDKLKAHFSGGLLKEKQPTPTPEEARFLRIEQALQALEQRIQDIEEHIFDMNPFERNDAEEEYEDTEEDAEEEAEEDGRQGVLFG